MEQKWLEDFLSLGEAGSFTRAARLRRVTQPALSRRIRALETWVGTDLVDRSSYPTRLTPAGVAFKTHAATILAHMNNTHAIVRGRQPSSYEVIDFALPHSLSLTLFPSWLARAERHLGKIKCRLVAGNVHDTVMTFVEGKCDLLMCYHHTQYPVGLDPDGYEMLVIDHEYVRPYAHTRRAHEPMFHLPGRPEAPSPFLSYAPGAYLRRVVDRILELAPCYLAERYQTDMADGLKAMALQGHGIAFLPESAVRGELRKGELTVAGDERWSAKLEIRIYRARRHFKPPVDRLWTYLQKQYS